jgi:hypothetical protein
MIADITNASLPAQELEPPHIFCRLIQSQQFGQFMLRLCYNPEMTGRPRDPEDGDPYRAVTIDSETFKEGALEPEYERAVLVMKGIPAGLFNYRLLALFTLTDCAAWQHVNQHVHSGEYPPLAALAAQQEMAANIVQRVKATYPEFFPAAQA